MSVQTDYEAVQSSGGDELSSRQLAQTVQFKINLDNANASSSPATASKLLEIFSKQSKQDSALSYKNNTSVPNSGHAGEQNNPLESEKNSRISSCSKTTAAPVTLTVSSQALVNDPMTLNKAALQADHERKLPQVLTLVRTDAEHSNLQVISGIQEGKGAATGAPNTVRVIAPGGQVPSVVKVTSSTYGSMGAHTVGSQNSVTPSPNRVQSFPLMGQKLLLNIGSQNLHSFMTVSGSSGNVSTLQFGPVSKIPPQRCQVAQLSDVRTGSNSDAPDELDKTNSKTLGSQSGNRKRLITVASHTGSCKSDLSKAPRLSEPSSKTMIQQKFKLQNVSLANFNNATSSNPSKASDNPIVAYTSGHLARPSSTCSNRIPLVGSKHTLGTYLNSSAVLSTKSSASITVPLGNLTTVIASGHMQAIAGKKSQVVVLSNQSAGSANTPQVSSSDSPLRNTVRSSVDSAPALLLCAPTVTHSDTDVSGNQDVSATVRPSISNLLPTHSSNSRTLQRNPKNPPINNSSIFVSLLPAKSSDSTNLKLVASNKDGGQGNSLVNTQTIPCVAPTNSLTFKTSARPVMRPIQPKPDNIVLPLQFTSNLTSQNNNGGIAHGHSISNLPPHLKKLIISKESLFNLNKISQRVNVVPKGISNVTTGVTHTSILNPSSASHTKPGGARSQSLSKNTRLSTASIPRRSYLQMLREDSPKERGSISLISNRNVNLKKDLKKTSTSSVSSQVSSVGPVFLTTTLRTASGPVSVKVRAPSIDADSETSSDAEKEKTITFAPVKPRLGGKGTDHSSLQKVSEGSNKHKIPNPTPHESQGKLSSYLHSVELESDSSDSDLEFLHDSEEQDLRVLSQLLQQDGLQTSKSQARETFADSQHVSNIHAGITANSVPCPSAPQSDTESNCSVPEDTGILGHQYSNSSSLKQGRPDADSDSQDLRIASVFSLNPTCESEAERAGEANLKEKSLYNSEVEHSEDTESPKLTCTFDRSSEPGWSSTVTPCYCVLERLCEEDIDKLSLPKTGYPHESGSRCSDYCRKRTLAIMGNLNLLPCIDDKSAVPLNTVKENNEKERSDSDDVNKKMSVLKSLLQKDDNKIQNQQTVRHVEGPRIAESPGSNVIGQGSLGESALPGNLSAKQKDTRQIDRSDPELASAEKTLVPVKEFESALKFASDSRVDQLLTCPQLRLQLQGNESAPSNSPKKKSWNASVFKQDFWRLQRQVEIKRIQMRLHKHDGKKGSTDRKVGPTCSKNSGKKVQIGKKREIKSGNVKLSPKEIAEPSVLTTNHGGEMKKYLVLPRVNKSIVARLLPPNSVCTQDTASPEYSKNDTVANKEIESTHKPSSSKVHSTPDQPSPRQLPNLAPAQNVQWSAKITEALKSLHSYLQSTGKQLSKTESQHFLLRLGEQHVLVSVPPSAVVADESSKVGTKKKPNAATSTAPSTSTGIVITHDARLQCKRSVDLTPAEAARSQTTADLHVISEKTVQVVHNATAAKKSSDPEVFQANKSLPGVTDKHIIHPQSTPRKNSLQLIQTANLPENSMKPTAPATSSKKQITSNKKSSQRQHDVTQSQSQASTVAPLRSLEKRPLTYADPSSLLSHLPLDSRLLPTPNRDAQKCLSKEKRASRRALLEKKYPLPPGVTIKVERDASCDNDTPVPSLGQGETNQASYSPAFDLSYEGQACTINQDFCSNSVLESAAQRGNNSSSFSGSNSDKGGEVEENVDVVTSDEAFAFEESTDSIICDSPDEPPPLVNEAPVVKRRRRKRSRPSRSTTRASGPTLNSDEQPPILQPMCDPPVVQSTLSSSEDKDRITPSPATSTLCTGVPDHSPKRQRLDPVEDITMSASTSSTVASPKQGFRATDVTVSKNIRIQRLKELLKKKEEEIETMKKIRSELPPLHLEDE